VARGTGDLIPGRQISVSGRNAAQAILHACEVVAYFNFVNRLADGLGIALEDGWNEPIIGTARPHVDGE
jgi:hypothetical protein